VDLSVIIVIGAAILLFGAVSRRLQTTVVTPPMIFVALGFAAASEHVGFVDVDLRDEVIGLLAELTLALVLFTDAARIAIRPLRRDFHLPLRLLGAGFPLTIAAGTLLALWLFPHFSLWEAALVGILLAPTDAALGQVVVSSPLVPVRIRQALNVESGLNDGLALPALLIALPLAGAASGHLAAGGADIVLRQLLLAPAIGVAIAYAGGILVERAVRAGWMDGTFQRLSVVALALLAFAVAQTFGASGFIAAFCGGLTFGNAHRTLSPHLYEFAEAEGQLLALVTFMTIGGMLLGPVFARFDMAALAYAVLSLTLVRLVPVAVSLAGSGVTARTALFLGWFGPRGLASIVFAVIVIEHPMIPHGEEIFAIAIGTVMLSVFAHGLTALPGARWYAAHVAGLSEAAARPELAAVTELPVRIPHRGHGASPSRSTRAKEAQR
jgi:sodium/hydrogen antiporter